MGDRRTVSDVCIDADNADNIDDLSALWKEVVEHKYTYSLVELRFMREHMIERAGALGRRDGEMWGPILRALCS